MLTPTDPEFSEAWHALVRERDAADARLERMKAAFSARERDLMGKREALRTALYDTQAELSIWKGHYQDLLRMPILRPAYDVPIGPMLITLQTELMQEGEARDEAERIAEGLQEELDANAWAPELISDVAKAVRREHDSDHGEPWAWCERSVCKLVRDHELE